MQILFLSHRLPYPPDKGERIRAFQELQYFGARHEVDLFCFADSVQIAEQQQALQTRCRRVHVEVPSKASRIARAAANFVGGRSISFGFFYSPTFGHSVRQALRTNQYDAIFVYSSCMGQYIPQPAAAPVVVDFVDADSHKFRQYAARADRVRAWFYARESCAVASAEQALGRLATVSFAVTEHDARELESSDHPSFRVEVIPNGVHVPECAISSDESGLDELRPFLLFVGTMNYPPNSDAAAFFVREILPLVRRRRPGMRFVIVGRDPDHQVRQLAAVPGVVVTGAVPDAFPYFRAAELSVAPFRISQGFHNKIAESLAVGTPVVTTSRAKAGIGLSERQGLFVADDPEEFARQVEIALDPGRRRQIRQNAAVVRNSLRWDVPMSRMEQFLLDAARSHSSRCELVSEN